MKKFILILALISTSLSAFSQTTEKEYYLYNIITFNGSLKKEGFMVDVDNGQNIEKLKDAEGKKINFKTPAAALMYFLNEGWELYETGGTTSGASAGGTGVTDTTTYWIIRKSCSKEELEKAVQNGIK